MTPTEYFDKFAKTVPFKVCWGFRIHIRTEIQQQLSGSLIEEIERAVGYDRLTQEPHDLVRDSLSAGLGGRRHGSQS